MNRWKCTTCNLSLHINNKNDHINGKRHRTLLVSPASNSWMCSVCGLAMAVTSKDSHIAKHLAAAQATTWTCDVCNSTISIKDKASHLAGAKHRSATQAPPPPSLWTCSVCSLAMAVADKDNHLATHAAASQAPSPGVSSLWTCTICSLTMAVNNKDSHLAGAKHRSAVRAADSSEARLPAGWWECETCDRAPMKAQNKDAHLKSKGHRASARVAVAKTKRWYVCTVCDKPILHDQMVVHNARHAKGRRWEKSRRGGGGSSDGGGSSSDDGDDDRYDKYEYDTDEEDGLSILRDIDTQWGMIPGGGAYKESNFYYGPGIHDYY